jgi:hypothetical protein
MTPMQAMACEPTKRPWCPETGRRGEDGRTGEEDIGAGERGQVKGSRRDCGGSDGKYDIGKEREQGSRTGQQDSRTEEIGHRT